MSDFDGLVNIQTGNSPLHLIVIINKFNDCNCITTSNPKSNQKTHPSFIKSIQHHFIHHGVIHHGVI